MTREIKWNPEIRIKDIIVRDYIWMLLTRVNMLYLSLLNVVEQNNLNLFWYKV